MLLLFHTDEATHQFYGDGFDDDGVYWYSGMGARGDMDWNFENRSIRDHEADGRDLLLFMRAQREGGLWRFSHLMQYVGHQIVRRPDLAGDLRDAIVFGLLPLSSNDTSVQGSATLENEASQIERLRSIALSQAPDAASVRQRVQDVLIRSEAVKQYALLRANGKCEACGSPAPFRRPGGEPFLEVHHLRRLSDGGPDRPDSVAGICPNCHRKCHYAEDAEAFNSKLQAHIHQLESCRN